jgi:hypothetical protein
VKQLKVRQGIHHPPLAHLEKQHVDSQPQTHPQVSLPAILMDTLLFTRIVNISILRFSTFLGVRSLDALGNLLHSLNILYIVTHQELDVKQVKVRQCSHQPPLAHL